MWSYEHSVEADAEPSAVWTLYRDVTSWPQWNPAVESVELDGEFGAGARGRLRPRGQGQLPFRIVSAEENAGYTSETDIAETVTLRLTNTVTPLDGGRSRITHRAEFVGPAADFFGQSFGAVISGGIPVALRALADRASATTVAER